MKKTYLVSILFLSACNSYKVSLFDNRAVVDRCTASAECEMDNLDDNDYYDIEDEDAYKLYLIESCVDGYSDQLTLYSELGCRAEYRAFMDCSLQNSPDRCEYDLDSEEGWEEYDEDYEEYSDETCWKPIQKLNECSAF